MSKAASLLIAIGIAVLVCRSFAGAPPGSTESRPALESPAPDVLEPPASIGHPAFLSPHAAPIVCAGGHVYVANTPADTVDVIDAGSRKIVARIHVGINPVGLAVRPDGAELWVSNHISDSVSVIDLEPASPTRFQVIDTIQDFHPVTRSTRFDEPVGIAFAGNAKAYVALSSENQIAVIDVATRKVQNRLDIPAQDPRALVVRGDRLYVIPFESNNQTQLSGGTGALDGELVTFNAWEHSIANNNVLSLGHVVDIVKHPRVPDRDLFVFDTRTDKLVQTVSSLGTLLYGLAVDSQGRVYVAQTDARNDVNGRAGTRKHGLAELENRAFLNRITCVPFEGDVAGPPRFIDLEPLPPSQPEPGRALATPFAIQVSDDDATLVATAAGSDKLFTVDVATGHVVGRVEVGALPEGIALESSATGQPLRAWVLNAAANTVSLVDVSRPEAPEIAATVSLEDPTHPAVKRGRIAFSTAAASSTGTFSCASCHPDGHTDQLLWVLNTPVVSGGDQIMPRSTMPVRGLRDTAPFHWDGVPGDPYGGINSASIHKAVPPNSRVDAPESTTRHLVDGGLASTMSLVGDPTVNDEGKAGRLSAAERDDLAKFLLSVPYPPAQRRSYNNVLSKEAENGFRLFHVDGDLDPGKPQANVCGDCHRMPFLVSTNTPGTGMDAPTWRGAYDRWLILPQGRLNIIDFDFYERVAQRGTPERSVWQFSWAGRSRFDPVWDMVLEGSTGFPGAFARQLTLHRKSVEDPQTTDLLDALEQAARDGGIILQAEGVFLEPGQSTPAALQFDPQSSGGAYVQRFGDRMAWTRAQLMTLAREGHFVGTFTGRLGNRVDYDHPQPALWTRGPLEQQRGRQEFPVLFGNHTTLNLSGRHLEDGAVVLVNGLRVAGQVRCKGEEVQVELAELPPVGTHFLQIQNPRGLISNDFLFHVVPEDPALSSTKNRTLGARLAETGWDRLVGTWVDADTNGAALKSTYAWKIRDRVLESSSREARNESAALIGVNAGSGEIFHTGADLHGGSFTGHWTFPREGDALLEVRFTSGNGEKGTLRIRYHFVDDDTFELTVELPQPITVRMLRVKE